MQITIKSARLLDGQVVDLVLENGVISNIGSDLKLGKIVDVGSNLLIPGLVDLHTHLREPGREDSETVIPFSSSSLWPWASLEATMLVTSSTLSTPKSFYPVTLWISIPSILCTA